MGVGDIQEPLFLRGHTCCLEQGCKESSSFRQIIKLQDIIVVKNHMVAQDILDHINGFSGDLCNVTVANGEDGDGSSAIDLIIEVGLG